MILRDSIRKSHPLQNKKNKVVFLLKTTLFISLIIN